MADTLSLATLDRFVGQELGISQWVRLDQQRIDEFADCTGDRQWIHVDRERAARESPFGGTIAHGYLTLATVGPAQLEVWIAPAAIATALHYGLDRVRFLAPVPAGGNVRTRVKLLVCGAERRRPYARHNGKHRRDRGTGQARADCDGADDGRGIVTVSTH